MKQYDVTVIGGGIAGLYTSLMCCRKGLTVCLLEKEDRWGGRIRTIKRDGDLYEAGAARFHKNHKHLIRLLKHYKIETVQLDDRKRDYRAGVNPVKPETSPSYELIPRILAGSKKYTAAELRSMTFGELAKKVIGNDNERLARASFGYDGEFNIINACDGVRMFSKDFDTGEVYYICKNGLGSLVDAIVQDLSDAYGKNWNGVLERRVVNISYNSSSHGYTVTASTLDGQNMDIKSRAVVLALPKNALLGLDIWDKEQLGYIDTVQEVPCERIYSKYARPWYSGIGITTTDLPIRQFIPITDKLAMVSYSDSTQADEWNRIAGTGSEMLAKRVTRVLRKLFPERTVPARPLWTDAYHWDAAIHMWKPNVQSQRIRRHIRENMQNTPGFYICGEAYSGRQCWVDGALQTVEEVMPVLLRHTTHHASSSIQLQTGVQKGGDEWKQWVKTRSKNGTLTKKDTAELSRLYPDAKWVLFQDRLIDLTQWYYMHPGGQTPYDNHMHKDVYPAFKHISHHYENSEIKNNVMDKILKLTIARIK